MSRSLLFLIAVTACMDEAAEPEAVVEKVEEAAPAPPPPKELTPEEKLEALRGVLRAGGENAVASAQELLAEKPEMDELWRMAGYAAIGTPAGSELLATLGAAEPAGGRVGPHHLLRAELALASADATTAFAAAMAAMPDQPDAAAALLARAVRSGAEVPEDGAIEAPPIEALIQYAAASDRRRAARYRKDAVEVGGWRAALLRSEVASGHGDQKAVMEELALLEASDDPRARVAAGLLRSRLAMDGALPEADGRRPGAHEAALYALAALRTAFDDGDGATVRRELDRVAALAVAGHASEEAYQLVQTVVDARAEDDVMAQMTLARAALVAGRPDIAARSAAVVVEGAEGVVAEEAAWLASQAGIALGDAESVSKMAAKLTGARGQAVRALLVGYKDAPAAVAGAIPSAGLTAADASWAWLEAGRLGGPLAVRCFEQAMRAAEAGGLATAAMVAGLEFEAALRDVDAAAASRARTKLTRAAQKGAHGDALRVEVAVRSALAGEPLRIDAADGPTADWVALASGDAPASADSSVAVWAQGRAAARRADPSAGLRYVESLSKMPLHRRGILAAGTVLDGSHGVPVGGDLAVLEGRDLDDARLSAALAIHESVHRKDAARIDHQQGRDLLAGLSVEQRGALLGAVARARAAVRDHLGGGGAYPAEVLAALTEAETGMSETPLRTVLPQPSLSLGQVRSSLGGAALLSFAASAQSIHGLVVKVDGGSALSLGDRATWTRDSLAHRDALIAAATIDAKADHRPGDRLREMMVNSFTSELRGVGRYQVVAPLDVMGFPLTTFPEQSSGLRYLADIRTVTTLPTIGGMREREPNPPSFEFRPPFLGIGAPVAPIATDAEEGAEAAEATEAAEGEGSPEEASPKPKSDGQGMTDEDLLRAHRSKSSAPGDLAAASRSFGDDFRDLRLGDEATLAVWDEFGGTARFMQFSSMNVSPDGGFALADGALTLSKIRSTQIKAEIVVVSAEGPQPVQLQRARAFLDAGAGAVLLVGWPVSPEAVERFLDGYFAAINRDRPPARALNEARESLMRDVLLGVDNDDPGLWGSMFLLSHP